MVPDSFPEHPIFVRDKKRRLTVQDYKSNRTHQSVWRISFLSLVRDATLNLGIISSCTVQKQSHKDIKETIDKYRQNLEKYQTHLRNSRNSIYIITFFQIRYRRTEIVKCNHAPASQLLLHSQSSFQQVLWRHMVEFHM